MSGTVDASLMPYRLLHLKAHFPRLKIRAVCSAGALGFVTPDALRAITGYEVYVPGLNWSSEDHTPSHLSFSKCDMLLMFPITSRVIAECAAGITSCPVTKTFAFTPKGSVVIDCTLHPSLDRQVYASAVQRLSDFGCLVFEGAENGSSWNDLVSKIEKFLDMPRESPSHEKTRLFT